MGLPVLTFPGRSFAARFCHSIVHAAGVPELLCSDPENYVAKAIGYAKNPASLKAIRDQLAARRESSVLRDIPGLARRLEEIFWEMQGECERGETPVPDLRNMEIYYEIGADLVQAHIEYCDDGDYRRHYRERLADWDDQSPIEADNRLWSSADR